MGKWRVTRIRFYYILGWYFQRIKIFYVDKREKRETISK